MIGMLLPIIIAVVAAFVLWRILRTVISLIANAALGVLALLVVNYLSPTLVDVDIWTVLVAAVGGIPGLLATIVLHSMGVV